MVICGNGYYIGQQSHRYRCQNKTSGSKEITLMCILIRYCQTDYKLVLLIYMHKYDSFFIVYLLQILDCQNFKFGVVR